MEQMVKKREFWIDNIKIFACIFVVLGHFYQSMVNSNILPDSLFYEWFNTTIYYFHVPLFFICSGYLYRRNTVSFSFHSHIKIIEKKFISLGIPYFTFSLITWALKNIFSSSVNTKADGLFTSLFVYPIAPYWFLYCLFFIFVITPIFKTKKQNEAFFMLTISLNVISQFINIDIYIIEKLMSNLIWFSFGIILYEINLTIKNHKNSSNLVLGIILNVLFISLSIIFSEYKVTFPCQSLIMGLTACVSYISLISYFSATINQMKLLSFLSKYTMHIYLLHTICAASLRSLLFKIGISNSIIHIIFGLLVSYIAPIIIGMISKKIKIFEFFFFPTKYIKIKS